jgi:two-component system, OmpR family, response regulator CssR
MKIVYVEDAFDLSEIIRKYLTREGYDVIVFDNGEAALSMIDEKVDLWILDIMLKGQITGHDLIKTIKEKHPKQPVIFTSARDQDMDKIVGLELGSDDYLAKPFSPRELILRVKAILKRTHPEMDGKIEYGPYVIHTAKRQITEEDKEIELTNKEFEMLSYFLSHMNEPLERDIILKHVWGDNYYGSDRVVDDLLRRLRQKMPHLKIETIYGFGYRML